MSAVLTVGASVIIGGDFTAVADTNGRTYPAARLAKYLPATGTFDLTWAPSTTGPVYALASSGDRLLVGGNFSKLDGRSHSSLGAVSLRTGDIDPTFTTTVDKQIDAIAIVGSSVYLGGPFTTVTDSGGSTVRSYTAKVSLTTGVLDPTWAPVMTARVRSLLPTPDGTKVYVGGDSASTNGLSYAGRLTLLSTADASIDPAFRAGATNAGFRSPGARHGTVRERADRRDHRIRRRMHAPRRHDRYDPVEQARNGRRRRGCRLRPEHLLRRPLQRHGVVRRPQPGQARRRHRHRGDPAVRSGSQQHPGVWSLGTTSTSSSSAATSRRSTRCCSRAWPRTGI